ncbi:hypothetical protein JZ751_007933 [Albula glossodonta]|uniref:Uncharacterized protein n=1 Tax=Albula glossodonta TaxID=121402 RepID=A0A8T2P0J7_9TELE|nr:hypothetical protein JZ751_007933 [Albula glossodonta]
MPPCKQHLYQLPHPPLPPTKPDMGLKNAIIPAAVINQREAPPSFSSRGGHSAARGVATVALEFSSERPSKPPIMDLKALAVITLLTAVMYTQVSHAKPISLVERCWCRNTHNSVPQRSIRELKFLQTPNCPFQVIHPFHPVSERRRGRSAGMRCVQPSSLVAMSSHRIEEGKTGELEGRRAMSSGISDCTDERGADKPPSPLSLPLSINSTLPQESPLLPGLRVGLIR